MALVVEDGTGKADADSYASIAFANTYLANRGVTSWDALDDTDDKEPALRLATEYMVQFYRKRWMGTRATQAQALDWPRNGVEWFDSPGYLGSDCAPWYPPNVVPIEIQRACVLLAVKANADGDLAPDLAPPVIEETVGPITVKYADGARQTVTYRAIDAMLTPFCRGGGFSFPIYRG